MSVQIFTHPKSQAGRAAQRFFAERRIDVHLVDARRKPPSPGELRRFVARFGAHGVLDTASTAYADQGLSYVSASDDDWVDRLVRDPSPIAWPLVRHGRLLSVGKDTDAWERIAEAVRAG